MPAKENDEAHPELKQNFIAKNLKGFGFSKKQVSFFEIFIFFLLFQISLFQETNKISNFNIVFKGFLFLLILILLSQIP